MAEGLNVNSLIVDRLLTMPLLMLDTRNIRSRRESAYKRAALVPPRYLDNEEEVVLYRLSEDP